MLVLGGVQAAQVVAGNLQIGPGGNTTLLAALAPSAYSTASLTVGGTFEVRPAARRASPERSAPRSSRSTPAAAG